MKILRKRTVSKTLMVYWKENGEHIAQFPHTELGDIGQALFVNGLALSNHTLFCVEAGQYIVGDLGDLDAST